MTIPSFPYSNISRDERGVYTVEIAGAGELNILSSAVTRGLTEAVSWLAVQTDARAVIIRGTGDRAFVGGADIFEMAALNVAGGRAFITGLCGLCEAVRRVPVPTIARIPGHCLGGGLELAAACDIRLASDLATFGMPEVRVGIPSVIHAVLLPRLIGSGAANWLMLTGERIDARQALQWGLLQFATPLDSLDELVEKTVAAIVSAGPEAIRSQKLLLRYWETSSIEEGIDLSIEHFARAYETDEPKRYMAPFLERRKK